jgi:hypothetical protein
MGLPGTAFGPAVAGRPVTAAGEAAVGQVTIRTPVCTHCVVDAGNFTLSPVCVDDLPHLIGIRNADDLDFNPALRRRRY